MEHRSGWLVSRSSQFNNFCAHEAPGAAGKWSVLAMQQLQQLRLQQLRLQQLLLLLLLLLRLLLWWN